MKKLFLFTLVAVFLVGCEPSNNANVSSEDSQYKESVSVAEESVVINDSNTRKVSEYKPYSDPAASNPTVDVVGPFTSLSLDEIADSVERSPSDKCIAKITLKKIAGETQEFEQEGYFDKFYYTDVEFVIDEIYVASKSCSFTEKENVVGYTKDKWKLLEDDTYSVEYIYREFPFSEENNSYIARLIRSDDGEKVYVQPLSFPFHETGEYTDSILSFKNTTAFDSVHWSFSDEVLKRYGITE